MRKIAVKTAVVVFTMSLIVAVPLRAHAEEAARPHRGIIADIIAIFEFEHNHGGSHGAPGPIVGAGLPFLLAGLGYRWVKNRGRKANAEA